MRALTTYRAVVTDLDGTVVREDGTVSAATLAAADGLAVREIPLIAATARTPAGVAALESLAARLTIAVCCGGALGWSPRTGEVLWRETIAVTTVRDLVRYAARRLPSAGVAAYDGGRWRMTEAYAMQRPGILRGPVEVVPAAEVADQPACSMTVCHPSTSSEELMHILAGARIDPQPTITYSTTNLVDISPPGIDKFTGVRRALAALNVPPVQAVAFGDMPIDIPMFRLCGHAVAVANAPAEVLAMAAAVAHCVHNDGFARMLSQLGMIEEDQAGGAAVEVKCGCDG